MCVPVLQKGGKGSWGGSEEEKGRIAPGRAAVQAGKGDRVWGMPVCGPLRPHIPIQHLRADVARDRDLKCGWEPSTFSHPVPKMAFA